VKPGERGEGWDKALDALDIDYALAAKKLTVFSHHQKFRCKQGVIGCVLGHWAHGHFSR
jgi:hypothetical protein